MEGSKKSVPNPSIEGTIEQLKWFRGCKRFGGLTRTNVVHGDSHCNNVFSLLGANQRLGGVALIDWWRVRSGAHPLTDISILIADLVFRVRFTLDAREQDFMMNWGLDRLEEYGRRLGIIHEEEGTLVLAVQVLRMLAWGVDTSSGPWLTDGARSKAWEWIQALRQDRCSGCRACDRSHPSGGREAGSAKEFVTITGALDEVP